MTVLFCGDRARRGRLRRDRLPRGGRRDRRRPAGQRRQRQARGRRSLVDRHLADDQHRHHRDRHRRALRHRRLARLADRLCPRDPQGFGAGAQRARRLRLRRAGDRRRHLLHPGPDPEPALLPHHSGDRRHGRLRHPRAAQTGGGGIPRRRLRRLRSAAPRTASSAPSRTPTWASTPRSCACPRSASRTPEARRPRQPSPPTKTTPAWPASSASPPSTRRASSATRSWRPRRPGCSAAPAKTPKLPRARLRDRTGTLSITNRVLYQLS